MKKNNYKKIDNVNTNFKEESFKVIKVLAIVLIVFGLFYLLTIYLTSKGSTSTSSTKNNASIQYSEILLGSSFEMEDDDYLVIYYDMSNSSLKSTYSDIISTYKEKEKHLDIYQVDMSNTFNKDYVSNTANTTPSNASELKINGPTLIKFSNKKVVNYVEGEDSIKDFLN